LRANPPRGWVGFPVLAEVVQQESCRPCSVPTLGVAGPGRKPGSPGPCGRMAGLAPHGRAPPISLHGSSASCPCCTVDATPRARRALSAMRPPGAGWTTAPRSSHCDHRGWALQDPAPPFLPLASGPFPRPTGSWRTPARPRHTGERRARRGPLAQSSHRQHPSCHARAGRIAPGELELGIQVQVTFAIQQAAPLPNDG